MYAQTIALLGLVSICQGVLLHTLNQTTSIEVVSQSGENFVYDELGHMQHFQENNTDMDIVYKWTSRTHMKSDLFPQLELINGPDILGWYAGGEVSRSLIKAGKILDLHDVYTKYSLYDRFPSSVLKGISDEQGHPYMIPTDYYHWAVYYSKSTFADLGLTPPTNWEEFLQICEVFKTNGITPISTGTLWRWPLGGWFDYLNMRINGPEFHINVTAGEVEYTDDRVRNLFLEWKSLIDKGYFYDYDISSANNWEIMRQSLIEKTAGMSLMGDFLRTSIEDLEVRDDIDFFQFPVINPQVLIGEDAPTDGFLVSQKSQSVENVGRVLNYFASDEYQTRRLSYTSIPANLVTASKISDPGVLKGANMIANSDFVVQFYDRDTNPEMANEGMDAMVQFTKDPTQLDSILEQLEIRRKEIYLGIAATPVVTPSGGNFGSTVVVTITTSTANADIFYTLDGTAPTSDSLKYNATEKVVIADDGTTTLRAVTIAEGLKRSEIEQRTFILDTSIHRTIGVGGVNAGIGLPIAGIVINTLLMLLIQKFKKQPAIRASSPPFVQTIILGCSIALSTSIWMSLDPVAGYSAALSNTMCTVQVWTISIGWALAFGSLLAKTWRVMQIFGNRSLKTKAVTNSQLVMIVLSVAILEIIICIAWSVSSPITRQRIELDAGSYTYACMSEDMSLWMAVSLMPKLTLLFAAIVVSIKTRNYVAAFNESKRIGFAVYNLACIGGASFGLSSVMSEVNIAHIIRVVGLFFTTESVVAAIAVPPLVTIFFFPDKNTSKSWFANESGKNSTTMRTSQTTGRGRSSIAVAN